MKHLTNPLGVIEQSNINTQPLWKEHSTCGVFQSWRIAVYCRTKVIECRRADSGIPIPSLPRSQWILFSTQHTLALSHHPTIITQQRGHTVSTETKSWSDSSPPRPKSFFSGPRRRAFRVRSEPDDVHVFPTRKNGMDHRWEVGVFNSVRMLSSHTGHVSSFSIPQRRSQSNYERPPP